MRHPLPDDLHSALSSRVFLSSLEELERRLEAQTAGLPVDLDDGTCVYYLCTTRCSGIKSTGAREDGM
jgi:hypothetical protein